MIEQLASRVESDPSYRSRSRLAGTDPSDYPPTVDLLPLRDEVHFPGTVAAVPLLDPILRQRIESALPHTRIFGLGLLNAPDIDDPAPSDFQEIGTLAQVLRLVPNASSKQPVLFLQILERVEWTEIRPGEAGQLVASYRIRESQQPSLDDEYWLAAFRNLKDSASELIRRNPRVPDEADAAIQSIDDPGALSDFLAGNMGLNLEEKVALLRETNVVRRLERVQTSLNNQLRIAEIQQKLRESVQQELSETQRRVYLREQLRAIQRELGEGDDLSEQVQDLLGRLEAADLPEEAMQVAERELKRLERIPAQSPETTIISNYLETLADLPWSKLTEDNLDLKRARAVLDRDHHGLNAVKKRLVEFLAVRKLNPAGQAPIICLLGPPGVGKTSLGQSIADALGRRFIRIALGGLRDEAEIRGHRRTYLGAMPGRLIQEIRRAGSRNPVLMLDEIDKLAADFRGDPASALLEVLDPRQNSAFVDRFLDVAFDLSKVMFIATANAAEPIPPALRDRMEVIRLPGYTDQEKLTIARDYLVPRQLRENGLDGRGVTFHDEALRLIVDDYTREAGVRNLERQIATICQAIAARVASDEAAPTSVTKAVARELSGPPRYSRDEAVATSEYGVVNGLAYTPVGGEVLIIEALLYPGKGDFILTGQLGDVMKESVRAAYSLVRNRAQALEIDQQSFRSNDAHIHVPAGAVPKDGPSAGIGMFVALASLFAQRKVAGNLAMTGEITLRGRVLPIGGLKEKLLAASRAGISKVLIPARNEAELEEVPEDIRTALQIVPVATVDEALREALPPADEQSSSPA